MKILNISYIGCGRIFKKHYDAYYKNRKYFNIDAVCDLKTDKIKKYNLSKKKKFLIQLINYYKIPIQTYI